MDNKKIAKLVSKKIYNPGQNETDFAIQLFVEKMVLPESVKSYDDTEMAEFILEKLNN